VFVDITHGMEGGSLPADRLDTWNAEVSWRRGPLWVASEFFHTRADSASLGDPELKGWWLGGSWILTGEMRPYVKKNGTFGSIPVSRGVYQNGRGAWEISARWSTIDLNDGELQGGEMDVASLGLTWWLTPFITFSANYRYIWHERDGIEGTAHGINTRIGVSLE
jgi:phosphate-selective porin OprO/OprP